MSELNSLESIRMLQGKLAEVRERADRVGECEALGNLGIAYYQAQEWERAIATLTDYLNLAKALGNQWQEGVAEYYLGFTQQARGEHWQAVEAFERAYRLFRQLGQEQFSSQVWQQLIQQGQRYFEQQQFLEASQLYKLQLKILLDFDDIKAASWLAIDLGKVYYYQKDFEQAIACYTGILDVAKTLKEQEMKSSALAWLGCSYRESGQLEQALVYFQKRYAVACQLDNKVAQRETLEALIDISKQLNRHEKTIKFYKIQSSLFKQIKDYPNEYTSLYNLARLQFYCQQYQEALSRFEMALQIAEILEDDPQKVEKIANAHYMLGQCCQNLGQKEAAIAWYHQAVDLYFELEIKNWAEQGLEYLVNLYRESQDYDKEIDCQKKRLKLVQEREDRISEQTLSYQIGNLYNNQKKDTEAIEYYHKALQIAEILEGDPQKGEKMANAHYMLGQCYRTLGQRETATACYQQAIELYLKLGIKNWVDKTLEHLANLYRENQEYEKEINCYEQRLVLAQEREERIIEQTLLYKIGNLYNDQKQHIQAIEYYQKALQTAEILEGDSRKLEKTANARYMLGQCCRNLGRKETAIASYQQAVDLYLELRIKNWAINSLKCLSDLYKDLKEYDKALNYQQERLKLAQEIQNDTEVQSSWYNLGCLYQDRYEDEQAVAALTQALSLAQKLPYQAANAHYLLGFSYGRLGQSDKAIEHYHCAERLYRETNTQEWAEKSSVKLRLEAQRILVWGDSQSIARSSYPHYLEFLEKLLNSNGNEEIAVPLLVANLDKLDETFLKIIKIFCKQLENIESEIAQLIANNILNISNLIDDLTLGQREIKLEISIASYEGILNILPSHIFKWAYTQINLGGAYLNRIRGDKAENLEQGIAACNAASEVLTRQEFPQYWAITQMNLGIAYVKNSRGDKAENLERAIAYHNAALEVVTRQEFPLYWAKIQMNLGVAYKNRILGEKAENLEITIACYNAALEVFTRQEFPQYWAITQMNLGIAYSDRIRGKKAENLEITIACYNAALEVLTRQKFPEDWAKIQMNLGNTYSKCISGENGENIEKEIACYNAALEVFTRQEFPQYWAMMQRYLGTAYRNRIQGEKTQNIEIAIACYEAALQVYTRKAFPQDWANTQNNLGNAYCERIRGGKAENLEIAIAAYENALEINTYYEAYPEYWANTQNNLGNAYWNRIEGEKAENLEMAITAYKSALVVRTREDYPEDWANTQNNLGFAYYNRIQGDKANNLEKAIVAYENVLEFYTQKAFSEPEPTKQNNFEFSSNQLIQTDLTENLKSAIFISNGDSELRTHESFLNNCATVQFTLAVIYCDRILGDKDENLDRAIHYCKAALEIRTREAAPKQWAQIQYLLGIAYYNRILGNKGENLDKAIHYYKAALEICTREAVPEQWAGIQYFLGIAYYLHVQSCIQGNIIENREQAIIACEAALTIYSKEKNCERWTEIQHLLGIMYCRRTIEDMAENIEKAIAAHQLALTVYTEEAFPEKWAESQHHIGQAYYERIRGDIAGNKEKAIAAYQAAFTIYTKAKFPEAWAQVQMSFGNVYTQRILGTRADNLEKAIAAYEAALTIFTYEKFPQDWGVLQNNLGEVYKHRIIGKHEENLKKALAACKASLPLSNRETYPENWGRLHLNLGDIYSHLCIYENKEEYLEEAQFYYQAGLTVFSREFYPERWATAQSCLSNIYRIQSKVNKIDNQAKIIECYQNSLQVFTHQQFSQKHAETLFHLGITYWNAEHFQAAYDAFAQAIDTVEFLRGEITSGDEAKRKLNEEWNQLYLSMVEVCLELGNDTAAIEYADRSKARNLVELIATRESYGSEISIEVRQRLQYLRQAIYEEKNRLAQDPNPDYSQISLLREEFQKQSPYKPLEFQQIQSLLDEETAILEWYILGDRFLTFILTPQTLHLQQSTSEDLLNLIDWTNAYLKDYQTNKTQWRDRLSQRLETLAQILHLDEILQILLKNFPTCKKLILIPHRYLHLFPIHALPVHLPSLSGNKTESEIKLLQECFPKGVSYAPSCQLLQQAKKRQRPHFNQLFAIQNPTKDLDFTDIEVEAIQSYFNPHQILKHDQAEKTAIDLNNAHCTHFSCHGYFNFNDPLKSALLLANSEFSPPPPEDDQTRYIPLQNGNLLDLGKCLTLEDILQLDLTQCRLVTLSACETGITDFTSTSDEYIGLPSGFILAGSPNVVSSLWTVNDLSTALLMIRFYENLNNGETVPLALNHAQTWLRDATVETLQKWSSQLKLDSFSQDELRRRLSKNNSREIPFAHPYYWAGFCAIGA